MKIKTIEATASREAIKCEDFIVKTTCIQQSDTADNDMLEFLKPMADYIAQLIIKEKLN